MKRLEVIVEGQSEREFVFQVLAPYLERCGVVKSYEVFPIVIRTSPNHRGGVSKYQHLKDDILKSLSSSNQQLVVSMMIDYFRLPSNMPCPDNFDSISSDNDKANAIEQKIAEDVNDNRFIPYIQVHEFEAFLYASSSGFDYCYGNDESRMKLLCDIIDNFKNPEEINTTPSGAPSKRILSIIPEYDKVADGNLIIMQNGIDSILNTCPRFKNWVKTLIKRLSR